MKRILVQARHRPPLEPGHEGATGAPGEAALVEEIQASLVGLLENDPRFEAVPVPGRIPPGLDVDAAIFLHADGAATPRASGYCFGDALFPVNRRLADLIAAEIERLPGDPPRRADSYTVNLAQVLRLPEGGHGRPGGRGGARLRDQPGRAPLAARPRAGAGRG